MTKNRFSYFRYAWTAIVTVACIQLALFLKSGLPVDTDIMDLFPPTEQDPAVEKSIKVFGDNIGKRLMFLVGHGNPEIAMKAADLLNGDLSASGAFSGIDYLQDDDEAGRFKQFFDHRFVLLTDEDRSLLLAGEADKLLKRAVYRLYNPAGLTSAEMLQHDPLFLFQNYVTSLADTHTRLTLNNQRLVVEESEKTYVLMVAYLDQSAFSIPQQEKTIAAIKNAKSKIQEAFPGSEVLTSGVIRHVAAGTQSAIGEISVIGSGSVIGILLLIIVVFRTLTPLIACLIPIVAGIAVALTACVMLFGSVHLFTLVFGASLIGISVDYSFHYLSDRLWGGPAWNAGEGLRRIFPGITMGLLTSVIGYSALSIPPFPGLRQVALFSAIGLTVAYLTVITVFPYILKTADAKSTFDNRRIYQSIADRIAASLSRKVVWLLGIALLIFCIAGFSRLQINDNINALQDLSQTLKEEDKRVAGIIGSNDSNQFFVIRGRSEQQVLETEERLAEALQAPIEKNKLESYLATSSFIPSVKRQIENLNLLKKALLDNRLQRHMQAIGYSDAAIKEHLDSLRGYGAEDSDYLDKKDSEILQAIDFMWVGKSGDEFVSIVTLSGLADTSIGIEIENRIEGVTFVDKVADISNLFKRYRIVAVKMVIIAYLLIFIMLFARYRFKKAVIIISPPLFAALFAVAAIGWLGQPFSLFNIFALLLVLGIGIDYTLFFAEADAVHAAPTAMAISLSALTTIMSFGFLSLSETQAIHAFGVTVLFGVATAFFLSILSSGINMKINLGDYNDK